MTLDADGWPGLLIGDISQPRGGPMLTGHASHQIGLDADIWLTPMPSRPLSTRQREEMSATLMVDEKTHLVKDALWKPMHTRLLKRAASYPEVERILVNPGIKKKLCDTVTGDRSWLRKVRPFWGHDYHFHMRIGCQPGSPNCKGQEATPADDGCGKPLAWWFTEEPWRPTRTRMRQGARPDDDGEPAQAMPDRARRAGSGLGGSRHLSGGGVPIAVAAEPAEALPTAPEVPSGAAALPASASAFAPTPEIGIPLPRPRPGN